MQEIPTNTGQLILPAQWEETTSLTERGGLGAELWVGTKMDVIQRLADVK